MANGKSKPSKRSANFTSKVKAVVREELQEELENKVAVIGADNETVDTANIPFGDVTTSANYIQLLPDIDQGLGQYNERVGNEIRMRHLDIKMLLQYVNGIQETVGGQEDQSLGVRVMILKQKDSNNYMDFLADSKADSLLENGTIVAPGPASYSGNTFNLFQKINREQFSVRYDKTFYIDRPAIISGTDSFTQYQRLSRPQVLSHRLTFGKRGLKLTYGEGSDTKPTNFPYVMVIGYSGTFGSTAPSDRLINYSYTANASYTDA